MPDLISLEFLALLPEDNDAAIVAFADEFTKVSTGTVLGTPSDVTKAIVMACAFLATKTNFRPQSNPEEQSLNYILRILKEYRDSAAERFRKKTLRVKSEQEYKFYAELFQGNKPIVYEFSEAQHNRIQQLINELREQIPVAPLIDAGHKRRLLMKLEDLQRELHKTVSTLDSFFGFIGLLGIELGKFGDNIKPLVDRGREISEIVVNVIRAVEGAPALPPASTMLHIEDNK